MNILSFIDGHKTYIAAGGLACLALYQLSQGNLDQAWHTASQALAVAGLRHAITKSGK